MSHPNIWGAITREGLNKGVIKLAAALGAVVAEW